MRPRRNEPRDAVMVRVEVLWEDQTGNPRISAAKMEDISFGGVSIRLGEAVAVGSLLQIKSPWEQFSGVVVRCRREKRDYLLGVQRRRRDPFDAE